MISYGKTLEVRKLNDAPLLPPSCGMGPGQGGLFGLHPAENAPRLPDAGFNAIQRESHRRGAGLRRPALFFRIFRVVNKMSPLAHRQMRKG
ncbi:MAG: hypothetical protein ACLQQ0_10960 [Limisphaerales bacterium]